MLILQIRWHIKNFLKDVPLTRNFPKMSTTPLKMRYMNTRTNSNQSIRLEYADNVAYKLGQALYFSYVPSSQKSESENFSMAGITVSQRWLDIAQKMGSTEQIKHRAELLSSMSKAYQNMSGKSLEGDPVEEVKEYWNNLVEIASPNIAKDENNQIALLIYRNVTSQIYTKYYWFIKNSLATAKDISNELDILKSMLMKSK